MKDLPATVSAFDAKTHLFRLLQEVQEGQSFTITQRGKPIACLVPLPYNEEKMSKDELLREFDSIREKIKGEVDISSYIQEGREH
ncbi:MAG: type II toxin-antitoxin system prevent-host-death family antitoxin [bacterium]